LDGLVEGTGAVFEAKFMLPWTFSEEAAAEKHMAQLQHNTQYVGHGVQDGGAVDHYRRRQMGRDHHSRRSALPASIVDRREEVLALRGDGRDPHLFGVELASAADRGGAVADMSFSNAWAEFAGSFRLSRAAFLEHEKTKAELNSLMPEDAKEAIGHGVRARRSKSGAVSFDLLEREATDAALQ
jgi:hypothetical protein